MITKYHTKSGSTYEVDTVKCQIRKLRAGANSNTKRIVEDWRKYISISGHAIGHHMLVVWGKGRDAVSDELGTPKDEEPYRYTVTSPVVGVE